MNAIEAVAAIKAKMKDRRPTLRKYLRTMAETSDRTAKEWESEGNVYQEHYRRGMAYAYRDSERMIEQWGFKEE